MKKFPALHTVSLVFKIFAWIMGAGTLAWLIAFFVFSQSFAGFSAKSMAGRILGALLIIIAGGIQILLLYGFAEGILVILAIEENTRQLKKQSEMGRDSYVERIKEKIEIKENDTEIKKKIAEKEAIAKREKELSKEHEKKLDDDFLKY